MSHVWWERARHALTALLAACAVVLSSDPRVASEAASIKKAEHTESCCSPAGSCSEGDVAPGLIGLLASECPCCVPVPVPPPIVPDNRGSAVESYEVAEPAIVAIVVPQVVPRPTSTRPASAASPTANDPPIYLRTCRFLC